jgi:transposase
VDSGIWDKVLTKLASKAGGKLWSIDSTSCKVHKHGHGGGSQGHEAEGIGKSRGGPNTKVHALVDGKRRIVHVFLSPGNRNDSLFGIDLCNAAPNGVTILADKAYDTDDIRAFLEDIGLGCCIPPSRIESILPNMTNRNTRSDMGSRTLSRASRNSEQSPRGMKNLLRPFFGLVTLGSILEWL